MFKVPSSTFQVQEAALPRIEFEGCAKKQRPPRRALLIEL